MSTAEPTVPTAVLLFVQGAGDMWAPDGSGALAVYLRQELGNDLEVLAPEMPDAETDPHYEPWRKQIRSLLEGLATPVILVGHSFGGSVLLKYLAEGPPTRQVLGLCLVSVPWWGSDGWAIEEYALPDDFTTRLPAIPIFLYNSVDDPHVPFGHQQIYKRHLPDARVRVIEGTEHSFVNGLPSLVDDIRALSGEQGDGRTA